MKKIEDILTQCIDDVKTGRCSLEDCLSQYPSMRKQLEPLLRLALSIQEPPDVKPSAAFKVRARVQLMEQIHAMKGVTKWPHFRYTNHVKPISYKRRFSMVPIIIAIVVAVSALGGGTALAAQGSLPGDFLYPVKLGTENVGLIFADDDADAELWLKFANTRLEEMAALDEKGRPERIGLAVNGYDEAIAMAMAKVDEVSAKGLEVGDLSALVAETTSAYILTLDGLADVVAEEAQGAIARAKGVSLNGYENAILALAGENPAGAMEINLDAMEGRLNRAKAMAGAGNIEAMEVALAQFQELNGFGEEISQFAQGLGQGTIIAEVAELVALATSVQLEILAEVYENVVPEQAKEAVLEAMGVAIGGYERAVEALEEAGALGDIPDAPPIPDGIPVEPLIPDEVPPVEPPIDEVPPVEPPIDEVPPVEPPIDEVPPVEPPIDEVPPVEPPIDEVPPVEPPIPDGIPDDDDEEE